jgi:hypothetical protein
MWQALKAYRDVRCRGALIFQTAHYAPAVLYAQKDFLVLISVRGWVSLCAMVRLEGLDNWGKKKSSVLIGTRTRDLLACSIAPKPCTLPVPPECQRNTTKIFMIVGVPIKIWTGNFPNLSYSAPIALCSSLHFLLLPPSVPSCFSFCIYIYIYIWSHDLSSNGRNSARSK